MSRFKTILVVLVLAASQLVALNLSAQPFIASAGLQTNRFGPHSLPRWLPVGDKLELIALIEFDDPAGSPTISVEATRGSTKQALEYVGYHPLYAPFAVDYYDKFLDFDPGLAGPWEITATDSKGASLPTTTDAILEPEFLPLVENVSVQGTHVETIVSWTLPDLDGFDVDDVAVRLINSATGSHLWQSESMPAETTSFTPPAGIVLPGVDYVYSIILGDLEGPFYENISWAFSQPFRLTIEGDYSQNGIVDAADYTVWRDNLGSEALINRGVGITGPVGDADYQVWKANFGQFLGTGGGSALPSAASLSPAVPEPSTMMLAGLIGLGGRTLRRRAVVG